MEIGSVFYPNPSSGTLYYHSEFNDRFIKAEFYDMLGNKVKESRNASQLDISELSEGFYSIRLTEKNGQVFLTRIIKTNQ